MDSKSIVRKDVWVQVPLPAETKKAQPAGCAFFLLAMVSRVHADRLPVKADAEYPDWYWGR